MRVVAWDTWAFLEVLLDERRASEVEELLDAADEIVTTREILAETLTFLSRRARSTVPAVAWWDAIRETDIRIIEQPLDDLHASLRRDKLGRLSFADLSLASAARVAGAKEIATADREFEALGLKPLFAP